MPGIERSGPQAFAKVANGVASMRSMRARMLPLAMFLPVLKSPGQVPDAEGLKKKPKAGIAGITEPITGLEFSDFYTYLIANKADITRATHLLCSTNANREQVQCLLAANGILEGRLNAVPGARRTRRPRRRVPRPENAGGSGVLLQDVQDVSAPD